MAPDGAAGGAVAAAAVPPIEIHDLTVSYLKRPVLWGIDLVVPEGVLVGIVGPNGAGKSTLIKSIMGLLPTTSGWVRIYGQTGPAGRRRIAYVPQRESVDWDFPVVVRDVVMMGRYGRLGLVRRPGAEDRRVADRCMARLGIGHLASRQIADLSGGQQQRVFLARALAQEADIYLMDEPFVGVDAATESAILVLLRELRGQRKTVMVVNHDLEAAREYFDYLLLINMRVVAFGPTADVFTTELLQKTYGGRLTILSEVAERVREQAVGLPAPPPR